MTVHTPDYFVQSQGRQTTQSRFEDALELHAPAREAPHNIEAEQALLGAILVRNEALDQVSSFLTSTHFFDPLHAEIFDTMSHMIGSGRSCTPVTIKGYFERAQPIAFNLTVPQYLGTLAAAATTVMNAKHYGKTIYDLAIRRNLITIGEDLVHAAYDSPVDFTPEAQVQEAESRLYAVMEKSQHARGFATFDDAIGRSLAMAEAAVKRGGGLSGLRTGLADLDNMMGGLQPSDLIILAGRPSMGKTALATNIAYSVAKRHTTGVNEDGELVTTDGGIVGFFSLEMSDEQLSTRVLAEVSGVPSNKIRRGELTPEEWSKVQEAADNIRKSPLYIDETGGITIAQLAARARRLKRQKGLGLLIVDYLQLLSGGGKGGQQNRVTEITVITTGLKALAKELGVPIIALSQLSRNVETRDDKRPQLSDLRESGSIEQDADVVMFVFREEYYVERQEPSSEKFQAHAEWENALAAVAGKAEIILGKQRHGPCGTVELAFNSKLTQFSNLARDGRDAAPGRTAAPSQTPRRVYPGKPPGWEPPSHIVEAGSELKQTISQRAASAVRRPS